MKNRIRYFVLNDGFTTDAHRIYLIKKDIVYFIRSIDNNVIKTKSSYSLSLFLSDKDMKEITEEEVALLL